MADFKRAVQRLQKQERRPKIQDDNVSEYAPKPLKKKRRGVSVFQRQLYKRKVWVEEYEAGKDQKRRDKRKVMRGYYRALRDLDREHKQIFGNSISTRSRRIAKKNGTYFDQYTNKQNKKKDLRFNQKDTWNELNHPSYQSKYRESNWKFFDKDSNENNNEKRNKNYHKSYNKKYRGNGNINYGKNNWRDPENQRYRENENVERNEYSGPRLNSFQKAAIEGNRIKNDRLQKKNERELQQRKRKKALEEFERQRKKRQKILAMKNRKGQPNLNMQMGLLLNKIRNKKQRKKEAKKEREMLESQQQIEEEMQNAYGPPSNATTLTNDYNNHQDESNSEEDVDDFLYG